MYLGDDPVGFIVSANIHRRHLTKQQQADLIVAAHKAAAEAADKPRQPGEVSARAAGSALEKRHCEPPRKDALLKLQLETGMVTGSFPRERHPLAPNVSRNHALLRL